MTDSPSVRSARARGLYAICDVDSCELRGLDVVESAVAMLDAGIPALQIRAKDRGTAVVALVVQRVLARRPPSGGLVFVNDRADIAELCGADGVHVGQDDLPPGEVRRVFPRLQVGLSTHGVQQFRDALALGLDYVALGPLFCTTSKRNPEPEVGEDTLSRCAGEAHMAGVSLVGIGGIDAARLPRVAEFCDFVAAISSLLPPVGSASPYSQIRAECEKWQRVITAQPKRLLQTGVAQRDQH